jgi:hypothetical protein
VTCPIGGADRRHGVHRNLTNRFRCMAETCIRHRSGWGLRSAIRLRATRPPAPTAPRTTRSRGTISISRKKKTSPVGNVPADVPANVTKNVTFYAFWKTPIFHQFSGFLKALCYKGFTEHVFRKLLSQHKKHQKEQLLKDPAARSHNSGQVLLQASRKPRLVTCAEAQRGTQKRVGASSNALRVSVQILCA